MESKMWQLSENPVSAYMRVNILLQMIRCINKHMFKLCDVPKLHQLVTCFCPESWTSFF